MDVLFNGEWTMRTGEEINRGWRMNEVGSNLMPNLIVSEHDRNDNARAKHVCTSTCVYIHVLSVKLICC